MPCNAGYLGSLLGSERSHGDGNGSSLYYSCLENSMKRILVGYSPLESQRVRHKWMTNTFFLFYLAFPYQHQLCIFVMFYLNNYIILLVNKYPSFLFSYQNVSIYSYTTEFPNVLLSGFTSSKLFLMLFFFKTVMAQEQGKVPSWSI